MLVYNFNNYKTAQLFSALITTINIFEQKISILQWFLKDYVTLKTGVIDAENFAKLITFKIYWNRSSFFILIIFLNISTVLLCFLSSKKIKTTK